jgi:dTDP-4-amino-4,6-dideoxygalactose transaminase
LREQGIDSRAFWFPLHRQKPYERSDEEFGKAIEASRDGLWLPSSFDLTYEQARTVADVVRTAVNGHA